MAHKEEETSTREGVETAEMIEKRTYFLGWLAGVSLVCARKAREGGCNGRRRRGWLRLWCLGGGMTTCRKVVMRSVKTGHQNHVTLFLFFVPKSKSTTASPNLLLSVPLYVPNFTPRRTLPDKFSFPFLQLIFDGAGRP